MSRDQPSAVLKATTRTGLLNRPSSRLVITVSKSVSSMSVSLQARPIGPKSSSTKQVSRSMPGTIDGDGGILGTPRQPAKHDPALLQQEGAQGGGRAGHAWPNVTRPSTSVLRFRFVQ